MKCLVVLFMALCFLLNTQNRWVCADSTSVSAMMPSEGTSLTASLGPTPVSESSISNLKPDLNDSIKKFYSFDCNADTYAPNLSSFSTIWALLNVLVVIISFIVYLMYLCFNKFVDTMTKA